MAHTERRELLSNRPLPDAVVCGTDLTALGVLRDFETAGVKVPDDVLVAGYDNATSPYSPVRH